MKRGSLRIATPRTAILAKFICPHAVSVRTEDLSARQQINELALAEGVEVLGCLKLLKMERETGVEPATFSLGNYTSIRNTRLMRQSRWCLAMQLTDSSRSVFRSVLNGINGIIFYPPFLPTSRAVLTF